MSPMCTVADPWPASICSAIESAVLIGMAKPGLRLRLPCWKLVGEVPLEAAVSMPITSPERVDQRAARVTRLDVGVRLG